MITLDSPNKSLEIILASAEITNHLPVVTSYIDQSQQGSTSRDTQTNGTNAVTIVFAPNPQPTRPTSRTISFISVKNEDTSASLVTIRLNNNSTIRDIYTVLLNVGDSLFYENGKGFYVLDKFGNSKSVTPITNNVDYIIATGTGVYTANVSNVFSYNEGLSFKVKFVGANTTTPSTLNINGLGAKSLVNFGNAALVAAPNTDIKAGQILDVTYDGTNFQIPSVTDNIQNNI